MTSPSPFVPQPRPLVSEAAATQKKADEERKGGEEAEADRPAPVEIDLDGLPDRVLAFPVPEGRYRKLAAIHGKVLFSHLPVQGSLDDSWSDLKAPSRGVLEVYDFETQKKERLVEGIGDFWLDRAAQSLLYRAGNRLRVLKAGEKAADDSDEASRTSGWIDLGRVKVSVRPGAEWRQMFREAWRLQRDHFWVEDMSGVDWERSTRATCRWSTGWRPARSSPT